MEDSKESRLRAEFEAFIVSRWGDNDETHRQLRDWHSGLYGTGPLNLAWAAYRAASASRSEILEALKEAQRAISSMKVEAETAALICEDASVGEHCETISQEGLDADIAIREVLAKYQGE